MTLTAPLLGARILVAEDDAILAFDIMGLLRKAGAEVLRLAEALAFAGSAVLSCAVLDVNLRRELVFPAAHVLKARRVPVIFHKGHGQPEKLRRDWPEAIVLNKPAPQSS